MTCSQGWLWPIRQEGRWEEAMQWYNCWAAEKSFNLKLQRSLECELHCRCILIRVGKLGFVIPCPSWLLVKGYFWLSLGIGKVGPSRSEGPIAAAQKISARASYGKGEYSGRVVRWAGKAATETIEKGSKETEQSASVFSRLLKELYSTMYGW